MPVGQMPVGQMPYHPRFCFLSLNGKFEYDIEYPEVRELQGDQLNMVVCFWYLVTSDLSSVRYCTPVH